MVNDTFETYFNKDTDILCVFGCLLTDIGKKIKDEMLQWILTKYDTIVVNQNPPGKLFEYPALKTAKGMSLLYNKPVLYLHTKGAAHATNIYNQINCRKIWKNEFIDNYEFYKNSLIHDKAQVLCPFSDSKTHMTFLNGFIATPAAFAKIQIHCNANRYVYEHLFERNDIECIARIFNDIRLNNKQSMNKMVNYINNFK